MRRALFVWLVAALFFVALRATAYEGMQTGVFFECPTPELAEETAMIEDLTYGVSGLPFGCYWVYGEKHATVEELIKPITRPDGKRLWIGKVKRLIAPHSAYSAGYIPEEMV